MKRAYSPKEIAAKKWVTLPWDEKWSKPFGFPAENASWFISGASASGKSSFVMQLGKELCNYGTVLYMSYEEKINQSFQRRMGYLKMNEVQGKFRVVTEGSLEEVIARLKKPKSPKFIIIDSFQVAGWDYPQAVELMETFPSHVVVSWIGHSETVARKHYLQTTDAHFEKAVAKKVAHPVAQSECAPERISDVAE